jgi:hypothetical protein
MWERRDDAVWRRSGAIMHVARSRAGWVLRERQNSRRARGQGRGARDMGVDRFAENRRRMRRWTGRR